MRKHYRLIMCAVFIFIIINGRTQELQNYLGIKGGISIPNLIARGTGNNPINTGYSTRRGPDIALFWEQAVTRSFSFVPGVEYSSQGGRKNGFQPFPLPAEYAPFFPPGEVPGYLYANFDNEIKLDYVMLQVLAKFNLHLGSTSPVMLYAEAGPFGAYLVAAKDVADGAGIVYQDEQMQRPLISTPISFNNKMDIKEEVHKGNFGIAGDIGVAYNFQNSRVFIEAGGNYGMLNIQKDPANGKNGIGAAIVRAGYAIALGAR